MAFFSMKLLSIQNCASGNLNPFWQKSSCQLPNETKTEINASILTMHQKLSIKLFIAFGKLWYVEGFSDDLIIM